MFHLRSSKLAGAAAALLLTFVPAQSQEQEITAQEADAYFRLLDKFENLWLDTTMACAGFFPPGAEPELSSLAPRAGRLLYGTDFPIVPFAWDREIRRLVTLPLDVAGRRALFSENARRVYRCGLASRPSGLSRPRRPA